jgi:glycosyltransferase involved in cell wall biosynthesis
MSFKPVKVLVVGQTPPPYGGQAIMIQHMLDASYERIRLYHVRMNFSADMNDIGKFQWKKIWKLLVLIFRVYVARLSSGAKILYYPPAGPDRVPIMRDVIFLNTTRWLFSKVVFHFHAAGVSEMHGAFSGWMRTLFERAYFYPDVAIRLSAYNPEDGKGLRAHQEALIPNGLEDVGGAYLARAPKVPQGPARLLFVGVLQASKGVEVLIEAAHLLHEQGVDFLLELMGRFESQAYEMKIKDKVERLGLRDKVTFLGVQTGETKHASFARCDIFCFPTFFESETFGLVALEAMQFAKPVVATRWRGVPTVVAEGETGFLVPPQQAPPLAEKIAQLLVDPGLRQRMGQAGRARYLALFTAKRHHQLMESLLASLESGPSQPTTSLPTILHHNA